MNNQQLWQAVLGELELLISKPNFNTWFKNTFVISYGGEQIVIGVNNDFTKTWLEKKYHDLILQALENITKNKIKDIIYQVSTYKPELVGQPTTPVTKQSKIAEMGEVAIDELNSFGLSPKYTFDNFIVGRENELAQAACLAVATKPGKTYNPLFIYGGVGLGKTHLLQAVGHQILNNNPNKKILYVTSEKFTNDFIQSVKNGLAKNFKDLYRSIDVLLVDDIQFIAGKESTQEEFFHTFNTLHQNNKQIIMSSDRPPKAIPALQDRLMSRFECGMVADVSTPSLETKIAILEINCKNQNFKLAKEIVNFIANNVKNNIRELEGALNRVVAYYQLNRTAPDLEEVKKLLISLNAVSNRGSVNPRQLINRVAKFYDISVGDLLGQSRKKNLALPRQITMYLMREETKTSYPVIGHEIGGRDHTTVIHACVKISRIIQEDEKIRQDIEMLRQEIYNN